MVVRFVRRDGSLLWVEVHANPLHHEDGVLYGAVAYLRRRDGAGGAGPAHAPRGRHRPADRAWPTGARWSARSRRRWRGPARGRARSGWSCSTSTASRRSTTPTGTRRATRRCARSRARLRRSRARARPGGAARRRRVRGRADRPRRALRRGAGLRRAHPRGAGGAVASTADARELARAMGVATFPADGGNAADLLAHADRGDVRRQGRAQRLAAIASAALGRRSRHPDLRHVGRARLARAVPGDPVHARRVRGRGAPGRGRGRRHGPPARAHADGAPSHEIEDFRAITEAIRAEVGDALIVNYSTGALGVPVEKRSRTCASCGRRSAR